MSERHDCASKFFFYKQKFIVIAVDLQTTLDVSYTVYLLNRSLQLTIFHVQHPRKNTFFPCKIECVNPVQN